MNKGAQKKYSHVQSRLLFHDIPLGLQVLWLFGTPNVTVNPAYRQLLIGINFTYNSGLYFLQRGIFAWTSSLCSNDLLQV